MCKCDSCTNVMVTQIRSKLTRKVELALAKHNKKSRALFLQSKHRFIHKSLHGIVMFVIVDARTCYEMLAHSCASGY